MLEEVTEILREYKSDNDLVVTPETTFEELELDSLDTVELIMTIEEKYSITIAPSEDLKSVGDLIQTIEALR